MERVTSFFRHGWQYLKKVRFEGIGEGRFLPFVHGLEVALLPYAPPMEPAFASVTPHPAFSAWRARAFFAFVLACGTLFVGGVGVCRGMDAGLRSFLFCGFEGVAG
jgi:hypothetical protein